jgi:hypothetical protein
MNHQTLGREMVQALENLGLLAAIL